MTESAGRFNSLRGRIRFVDHGDAEVDLMWRERLDVEAIRRHASLGGAIPPEDAYSVPSEYVNAGRIPDTWFDCMDILAATTEPEILSD